MAQDDPALAQAAKTLLAAFLKGAQRPERCSRAALDTLLDQPSRAQALGWLIDNGFLVRNVYHGTPPTQVGHHSYGGTPGFDGYYLEPDARDVVRRLFGAEVWTAK